MQCISFIYPFIPFLSVAIIIYFINNNLRGNYAYKNIDKSVKNIFHIVVILWVAYGIFYTYMAYNSNKEIYNRVGDAFGAFNALFSGAAFVGTIYAIILQIKELRSTKEELAAQKQELQIQNATSVQARFENTFFNLLETHRVIAKKISYSSKHKSTNQKSPQSGIYSFKYFVGDMINYLKATPEYLNIEQCIEQYINTNKEFGPHIARYRALFYKAYHDVDENGVFGSYFRLTYKILKFVDESDLHKIVDMHSIDKDILENYNENDILLKERELKYNYIGIFRAQLSSYELAAIFFNGIAYNKMKHYIERYHLLRNAHFNFMYSPFTIFFYNPLAYSTSCNINFDTINAMLYDYGCKNNNYIREPIEKWCSTLDK